MIIAVANGRKNRGMCPNTDWDGTLEDLSNQPFDFAKETIEMAECLVRVGLGGPVLDGAKKRRLEGEMGLRYGHAYETVL